MNYFYVSSAPNSISVQARFQITLGKLTALPKTHIAVRIGEAAEEREGKGE